jgi:hypothetical protein
MSGLAIGLYLAIVIAMWLYANRCMAISRAAFAMGDVTLSMQKWLQGWLNLIFCIISIIALLIGLLT